MLRRLASALSGRRAIISDSWPAGQDQPLKWFPEHQREQWFREHYDSAAAQVIDFFAAEDVSLTGRKVADIGCGDGIIDLGVTKKAKPESLVGFDLRLTDRRMLRRLANQQGVAGPIPNSLEFRESKNGVLSAPDGAFDYAFSWSVFEHVEEPISLLREVRRILSPQGALMIQIFPLYFSEHGSHLWDWYPKGFAQFVNEDHQLLETVTANPGPDPDWAESLLWVYPRLNRITLDDLQRSLLAGGFAVSKVELMTGITNLPMEVATRYPLSWLGIAGVKLMALPLSGS